jgi:predicted DNA-binding transcriptional regulator AlpA
MKIAELASNPNVQIVVTLADLRELFLEWQEQYQNTSFKDDKAEETFLTPDEVQAKYRVSKVTLWRNAKNGLWPKPVKVGRKSLYRQSEIEAVLNPSKVKEV